MNYLIQCLTDCPQLLHQRLLTLADEQQMSRNAEEQLDQVQLEIQQEKKLIELPEIKRAKLKLRHQKLKQQRQEQLEKKQYGIEMDLKRQIDQRLQEHQCGEDKKTS